MNVETKVRSVIRNTVGILLTLLVSKNAIKISIPWASGIFVYRLDTAKVTGIEPGGWGPFEK